MNLNLKFLAIMTVLTGVPAIADAEATMAVQQALAGYEIVLGNNERGVLGGVFVPEPQRAEAQSLLQKMMTTQHPVMVPDLSKDRYGRVVVRRWQDGNGHLIQPQLALLGAGLAFVWPPTGEEGDLTPWFKAEEAARQEHRGLWQNADFADFSATEPDAILKYEGRFAFVTGKVVKAARIKNKVYLHFKDDWHHDFTIEIAAHDLRDFRHAGIDPLEDYTQHLIRVRGWVARDYGPMITVTHPSQIQRLDERAAEAHHQR